MFRFANPDYLYLLLTIPFVIVLYVLATTGRKKALRKFGNPELLAELMPDVSPKRRHWKFWILLGAIATIILVIAGPQFGSKLETVKRQGVEIMVCLDVSNSMLAEDVSPNRLEKAKQILSRLTEGFSNDKLGLIVFAGDAFTQLPITSDYISAKMFLSSIDPSMVSTQGTAIGAALDLALRSFSPSETADKAIILITDGENHEGNAVEAAQRAADNNIRIHIVGMGQLNGSPIPTGNNTFMKDAEGNVVITKLNEPMCQEIAAAGQGIYVRADNTNTALKNLQNEINKMKKAEVESKIYTEYEEQFQTIAWICLALLLLDILIIERKSRIFRRIKLFTIAMIFASGTMFAQKAERQNIREGNKLYKAEKFTEAEIAYRKSTEVNPRSVEGAYNLGNALYKEGKYPEAAEQYQLVLGQGERLAKENPNNLQKLAQVLHNTGNIHMQGKDYAKSIEAYKQSLRINPSNDETRYNLALAKKLLDDQQQEQENQDNQEQQNQDEQQEQQQPQDNQQKSQEEQKPNEQMSRDNAQQILDAFLQDEKDTQDKVKQMQQQHSGRKTGKQW
ncbi:MAG: VWA domain-containing protein [Tannerellaceae bacterium]|jgi:Ca-activated chloride channel family protein|nr:VWA domain-containing protein [Tannerellaceae bacterium]